jgi:UDP-N-acetylmuramoyl-L-alanine---L-glutamate ligase
MLSSAVEGRVGVWGAAREGRAALVAIAEHGAPAEFVVHSDAPPDAATVAEVTALTAVPTRVVSGAEGLAELATCSVVIRSPGVSLYRPEVERLRAAGVPLRTGTNLWFAAHRGEPIVAVTGTKGKSTTASLTAQLLRHGGIEVGLAGNVGRPLLDLLAPDPAPEAWVVELSSFQIADLEHAPTVAVLLNLYPEHTDWHGSAERYFADKLRLLDRDPPPLLALNAGDPRIVAWAESRQDLDDRVSWFGSAGAFQLGPDGVELDGRTLLTAAEVPLAGRHNLLNVCAACTAARLLGADPSGFGAAIGGFAALPHRLQELGEREGRLWVNDSISTTPESAVAALATYAGRPIVLIAGGYDRGRDFTELAERIASQPEVAAVIGLPASGPRLLAEIERRIDGAAGPRLTAVATIEEAVEQARRVAPAGAVILLSPAAPSHGQFRDFEHRGEAFTAATGFAS